MVLFLVLDKTCNTILNVHLQCRSPHKQGGSVRTYLKYLQYAQIPSNTKQALKTPWADLLLLISRALSLLCESIIFMILKLQSWV